MDSRIAVHVVVSGLVQGVCYRAFVWDEARERSVHGWVRNLPDGSVEAELEGESANVQALIKAMRQGPRMAHVTGVEVTPLEELKNYTGFRVR